MPLFPLPPLTDAEIAQHLADVQSGAADVDTVFQRFRDAGALFHYDCKPQKEDARDYALPKLSAPASATGGPRRWRSRIENQGQFGSCTGQAGTSVTELLEKKRGVFDGDLARLFCYNLTRLAEGSLKEDAGATVRDTLRTLCKYGVPLESSFPYKRGNLFKLPPQALYPEAKKHRITGAYYAIRKGDVDAVRSALSQDFPVILAMNVYSAFESLDVANHGVLPLPKLGEDSLGGHCVYIDWYDDADVGYFTLPNSWGTSWGDDGQFHMSYEYFRRYTWDAWAVTDVILEEVV